MTFSSNFLYRLFYGLLFTGITFLILYTTKNPNLSWIFTLSLCFLHYFALSEFFALAEKEQKSTHYYSYIGSVLLFFFADSTSQVVGYLLSLLFLLGGSRFSKIEKSIQEIGLEILGAVYITVPLFFVQQLTFFPILPMPNQEAIQVTPPFWLVAILCIAKGSDMIAYFFGKSFGTRLLAPTLSPKKTIEGAFGGMIGSCIAFWSLFLILFDPPTCPTIILYTLFSLILGIVSQIGDLIESVFKRDAGVKESSNYLPGLGGILDMIDSLLFTIPSALLLLSLFTLVLSK